MVLMNWSPHAGTEFLGCPSTVLLRPQQASNPRSVRTQLVLLAVRRFACCRLPSPRVQKFMSRNLPFVYNRSWKTSCWRCSTCGSGCRHGRTSQSPPPSQVRHHEQESLSLTNLPSLNPRSVPLRREEHAQFAFAGLCGLPASMTSLDARWVFGWNLCLPTASAPSLYFLSFRYFPPPPFFHLSRCWLSFWLLHSLELLQRLDRLTDATVENCIDWLARCQHPSGGFGGGTEAILILVACPALPSVGRLWPPHGLTIWIPTRRHRPAADTPPRIHICGSLRALHYRLVWPSRVVFGVRACLWGSQFGCSCGAGRDIRSHLLPARPPPADPPRKQGPDATPGRGPC